MKKYHHPAASNLGHKYQYRPTPLNHPFLATLSAPVPTTAVPLPASVDLRPYAWAPRDQGQEGCCTGFASAAFREMLHNIANNMLASNANPPPYLSPAYLYANARKIEGTFPQDSGATIADEFTGLVQNGVCPESFLPYTGDASEAPTAPCDVAAASFRLSGVSRVDFTDVDAIKTVLAAKQPIVIAFEVYQSFESPDGKGVVPLPDGSEAMLGGHGVLVVGYNDVGWIVRNSWGEGWGLDGYVIQPYNYEALTWMEAMTAPAQ